MSEIHVRIRACSISRSVRDALPKMPAVGRVLSIFRRACVIQYGHDMLVALVAPELGNGPLNVVLARSPSAWLDLQPGMPVQLHGGRLQLGGLKVSLEGAETWEPRPDWKRLRACSETLLGRLEQLLVWACSQTPGDTLLALFQDPSSVEPSGASVLHARARRAAEAMWAGWSGDEARLSSGTAQLAGLGSGLTPAGDDFVLGAMLCAWLAHPTPGRYCETVLEACVPRTTMLSKAFLRTAAAGECGALWHRLLEALEGGSAEQLDVATREVLSYGHSSGADALAGFLWMGLRHLEN
jgi:hypothetical protein